MKFVIEKWERQGSQTIITGKTEIGMLKGIWKSQQEPAAGEVCHVELNIQHPKEATQPQAIPAPWVRLDQDKVLFMGICEERDSEVYYLRFDIDWLEMLEADVIVSQKGKGETISFSADWHNIEIYPYKL